MSDYGPSLQAAKLYRKTSKSGGTYFVGRMGLLKVALLKSRETADDGSEIWNLLVSQAAAPKQPGERRVVTADDQQQRRVVSDPQAPLPVRDGAELSDEIPF